ncbi:TIM barrel protein [Methanococcus voltae]|uniref:Xylose isomerase domain protein TIM barrel n=1 Tax=Methanococcus voltae (strain ATCC BAA-1334 / A3) TaxID=456320 RepID=D7DT17_METV3|nr:TIM barrel protein [Methanococcus voltae]MCS3901947.1 endonuclease IV [Methanococcus voltae]
MSKSKHLKLSKPVIGLTSLFFWEYPIEEIVDIVRELELSCFEFVVENPEFWKNRYDEDYLKNLKKEMLKIKHLCVHAPYIELNPASTNENLRNITLEETFWALNVAKFYEAKHMVFHAGQRSAKRLPRINEEYAYLSNYIRLCCKLNEYVDYRDLESVQQIDELISNELILSVENSPQGINKLCKTPEEINYYLNKYEKLRFTLDFVHARTHVEEFLKNVDTSKISNVHISGVNSKDTDHYSLKNSEEPYKSLFEKSIYDLVHKYNYKSSIILEFNDLLYNNGNDMTKKQKMDTISGELNHIRNVLEI